MKPSERTLTNLLNRDRRVYLFIANSAVWSIFCRQAVSEGFQWSGGGKIPKKQKDDVIAMNNDMSFNYVGWAGHMRFHSDDPAIERVDFARYINGADSYIIKKENGKAAQEA